MLKRRRRANRWLAAVAAALVALGAVLITAGAASASVPAGHYPAIRFWSNFDVVTMRIPSPLYCPKKQPKCEWMLYVNEDVPAQTVVGTAVAFAGQVNVVQVSYPADFCGIIQADALVGPNPWLIDFGHKMKIDTCDSPPTTSPPTTSPPTTSAPTTSPPTTSAPTTSPPTTKPPHTAATSVLPFSGPTSTDPLSSDDSNVVDATTATTAPATLPFTGADLQPLVVIGAVLILAGLSILTSLEQRRRALRRVGVAVSTGAQYSSRASHWFLGD